MRKQKWYKSYRIGWLSLALVIIELIIINTYFYSSTAIYLPTVINPHFIENASHGMIVELGPNDVILAGRAGYEKNISGNIFKVQICEECGIENDCLQNNLNRLPFHNETALLNLTKADLKYFYVFAVIQNDVTNNYRANENIDDTYHRVFEQICNNKNYWAGIK